jgi:hypothetical protein
LIARAANARAKSAAANRQSPRATIFASYVASGRYSVAGDVDGVPEVSPKRNRASSRLVGRAGLYVTLGPFRRCGGFLRFHRGILVTIGLFGFGDRIKHNLLGTETVGVFDAE